VERNAAATAAAAAASVTVEKAAVTAETVDLESLLSSYKDNEIAADASFKGKQIRVTGIVGDVKKDILDNPYVIVGTGKDFEIPTVQCSLSTKGVDRAATLHKGDSVTMRGTVSGLMFNVQLKNCEVL
jgi:hypothetical protein